MHRILPQRALVELPRAACPDHPLAGRRRGHFGLGGPARAPPGGVRQGRTGGGGPLHGGVTARLAPCQARRAATAAARAAGGTGAAAGLDRRVRGAVPLAGRRAPPADERPQLLHDQVTVRVAAIDIGTNSTRLLVADADGGTLREVERLLEITRLGDRVDADGELAEASMQRVETCVARYAERARELDASMPLAVATSAVRDAANGAEFMQRLEQRCGVRTRVLTGEQEARLTLRGVVSGRTLSGAVVVCDIGGGSTELIAGDDGRVDFAVSLNLGCVRMSERHLHSDPPTAEEVAALRREAAGMLPGDVPAGSLIGVAGTITTLATIDLGLDEEIPERVDGHELSAEAVAAQLQRLAALPLQGRRPGGGVVPGRGAAIAGGAPVLAGGLRPPGAGGPTRWARGIPPGAAP